MRGKRFGTSCRFARRVFLAGLGCAVGGMLMSAPVSAMSEQRARPVIALSCPQDASEIGRALCDALKQALRQASPHAVIRDGEEVAPMAGSLALKLVAVRETRHGIVTQLQWKTTPGAGWETGPEVALDSPDVALRGSMLSRYAEGLIRASRLPLPAER